MTAPRHNKSVTLSARIAALDEAGSLDAIRARVAAGDDPLTIIAECQLGMRYVGEHYQSGKYFISGLIMAGEIFREAMEIIEPLLPAAGQSAHGTVVGGVTLLCTVRGDIHDIGKSIVVTLLRSHGFTVHDLGVDVPPSEVARQTRELRPDVVGLSGLLTSTHSSMKETVAEVRRCAQPGHRPPVIIIGGSAVDEQVRAWTGADLWANDAVRGVELIRDRLSCL